MIEFTTVNKTAEPLDLEFVLFCKLSFENSVNKSLRQCCWSLERELSRFNFEENCVNST